ncbi:MAG: hypothetical protein QUS33_00280 [Dehalococcoidia bacterium]|nr:hypothetical protein [Dehalococcoidia bacterium]
MRSAQVMCYSGCKYADRPVSFTLDGITYAVERVEKEWQEPGTRHFRVCTREKTRAHLCYNERHCAWSVSDISGKEPGQ